jgi:hypothetical protein
MKYTILLTGIILVLINTVAGLIFQDYATHKMLFADLSIILTTGILFLLYQMKTADGFKIGFSLLFGLTGLLRFICAVSSGDEFKNNYALLIFIIIFSLECVLIFVSHAMRNK